MFLNHKLKWGWTVSKHLTQSKVDMEVVDELSDSFVPASHGALGTGTGRGNDLLKLGALPKITVSPVKTLKLNVS